MRPRLFKRGGPAAAALLMALLVAGCAGSRIRMVDVVAETDTGEALEKVERYNSLPGVVLAAGTILLPGGGRADFGARANPALGGRIDAVAGPFSKLLFSAACLTGDECAVYLPDEARFVTDPNPRMGGYLAALLAGRVPLIGEPVRAGRAADGGIVISLRDDAGAWQRVVLDPVTELPARVVFGDHGQPASLEVSYFDFRTQKGAWLPHRIVILGSGTWQQVELELDRVRFTEDETDSAYRLRRPAGARLVKSEGRETWMRMGLFWTP